MVRFCLFLSILTGSILALIAPLPSFARSLTAIQASGTLKVGLTGDYAPFSFRDSKGEYTGADITMALSLTKTLGLKLAIVPTTWKTLLADLEAERFDIAMGGVSVTADRAAVGYFSVPVLLDGKRPIVRCADRDRYTSISSIDRPDVRVVVHPGGTNERFDRANFPHAQISEYPDNRTIYGELEAGRADVIMSDGEIVDYQSRRHPGTLCPANVAEPFDHYEKAYLMSRDLELKQAVDAWVVHSLDYGRFKRALADATAGISEECGVTLAQDTHAHAKRRLNLRR
jgi:cyclohexadienyl dehydratase